MAKRNSDLYAIVRCTFESIASAMGWDREFPDTTLIKAVKARLEHSDDYSLISSLDAALAEKLDPV